MSQALSVAGGWAVALAIAVPFVVLFWWAHRHEPVTGAEVDYSVGRRTESPAEAGSQAGAPVAHAAVDAPVPANPAALAPPTETVAAPAITVTLPAQAPLPPEPPSVVAPPTPATTAPAAATPAAATPAVPEPNLAPERPVIAPTPAPASAVAPEPVTVITAPAAEAPERAPKPPVTAATAVEAPVPATVVPSAAKPASKPAPPPAPITETAPTPVAEPVASQPEPAASAVSAPAVIVASPPPAVNAAAAEPTGESDDFSRLYGPDTVAIAALQAAGIRTYRQLAGASVPHLREILAGAGQPDTDPATWPQQARFAAGGKWKQLDTRFKGAA